MPDRGFRDQWAELSFEKKMSIFVGPVVVVVVGAVLTAALSSWGDGDDPRPTPPTTLADERIEVLDFVVDGGERQDLVSDPPTVFPQIDVTLRNVGASVSVITGAQFGILDFGRLRICEAGGGPLESSKDYDVVLPVDPAADQVLRSKVSQALEPNSADRFTFTMNVEPRGQGEGVFLYRLDVRLVMTRRTSRRGWARRSSPCPTCPRRSTSPLTPVGWCRLRPHPTLRSTASNGAIARTSRRICG
ncbi:hypothetical protein AFL01nite_27920 [Aeromicrobium flavum]|uniref:Uncharacterized protein n=1 Tax=Aeromicrobium flavum TaxID=416568 RepID=A0A512HYE5_9ACTN|nr:hypothetical protein [Aeromicrobium flavum]GEO90465.1 hypothetical protein AFL01nite_27920 [Aeromicrobium flavum]